MISVFLREQKRYTQGELVNKFCCSEEKTVRILKRLKEYGVLKAVKANDVQKDLSDLVDEDIEIADVEVGENEYLYVLTFVGVITIEGRVLKCYPKYLLDAVNPGIELKQVLKVLEKFNSKEQIMHKFNTVRNCFLLPTESDQVIDKGTVTLPMMSKLGLQDIQVRLLPAKLMYQHYLQNSKMDIRLLSL